MDHPVGGANCQCQVMEKLALPAHTLVRAAQTNTIILFRLIV
jgi:hypothetical protein